VLSLRFKHRKASLPVASSYRSEHFIGLAGSGAKDGLSVSWGEWLSPFAILLLAWLFLPFYLSSRLYTMPEFLEKRFGAPCRTFYACTSIALYVLTKISVSLYAGAIVLRETIVPPHIPPHASPQI
jgi:solute:Na+ symporter, SSS family